MATIRRGKYKGRIAKIDQWCNDWVAVVVDDARLIVSPSRLTYTIEELMTLVESKALFSRFWPDFGKLTFIKKRTWNRKPT